MRCLSSHGKYSVQAISPRMKRGPRADGTIVEWADGEMVVCNFDQTGLLDYEIEAVLEHFNFSGIPDGVNPLTTVSCFDTEAYVEGFLRGSTEEEKAELLEKLDRSMTAIQKDFPNDFIIVEKPASPKPWPSYDDDSVEDILDLQQRMKFSAQTVRLYELEHENRDEVIEAMLRQEDPAQFSEETIEVEA